MKFTIQIYQENPESKFYSNEFPEEDVEFESDWFLNTTPSIKDTNLFIPEYLDANDFDTVVLLFLETYSKSIVENNKNILCEEAKIALLKYNTQDEISTENKLNENKIDVPF